MEISHKTSSFVFHRMLLRYKHSKRIVKSSIELLKVSCDHLQGGDTPWSIAKFDVRTTKLPIFLDEILAMVEGKG